LFEIDDGAPPCPECEQENLLASLVKVAAGRGEPDQVMQVISLEKIELQIGPVIQDPPAGTEDVFPEVVGDRSHHLPDERVAEEKAVTAAFPLQPGAEVPLIGLLPGRRSRPERSLARVIVDVGDDPRTDVVVEDLGQGRNQPAVLNGGADPLVGGTKALEASEGVFQLRAEKLGSLSAGDVDLDLAKDHHDGWLDDGLGQLEEKSELGHAQLPCALSRASSVSGFISPLARRPLPAWKTRRASR
jgi:hypothetical protein